MQIQQSMKKKLLVLIAVLCMGIEVHAQFTYGTSGLLNMPTGEMQRDKTFLCGFGFLENHTTPARWTYDTWNYYINITIFPWMEVAYTCTLHKAMAVDPAYGAGFWVPSTYGKFVNQDRNFSLRLRLWKEGWWKSWTPQIVIGGNDCLNNSWTEGSKIAMSDAKMNGFYSRYYVAVTKHFSFERFGELGAHAAYVYNKRHDYPLNGPCFGANFNFDLPRSNFWTKLASGVNVMAEYDSMTLNAGMEYAIMDAISPRLAKKVEVNAMMEMNRCKYWSGGLMFKVHLK